MDKRLLKPAAAAGVLALAAIGWLMGPSEGDGPDRPSDPAGISREQAWDSCKTAVEGHLKNPGSADFQLTSVTTKPRRDGYDIAGSLTADNDFGAEQQLAFSCIVTKQGATAEVVHP